MGRNMKKNTQPQQYRFERLPGDPDTIIWVSELGSGVVLPDTPQWIAYQAHSPLPEPDIITTQAEAMEMVDREFEGVLAPIKAQYTPSEIESWPAQLAEARAWQLDGDTPTPLLDGILLPWEDKAELCQQIIDKGDEHAHLTGEAIMWRRIAIAAIESLFAKGPRSSVRIQFPDIPSAT